MAIIIEMDDIQEELVKAKKILDESKAMVQKMQDIVFCMEVEAKEIKEELEFRQSKLESEIHE